MCLGFVRSFGSFFAVRAVLGVAEGGLLPGMVLYLSALYTRQEMALRIGIFYTAASLSGAFGGLLARGLSAIGPRGGLEGWRWIFIIEGLIVSLTSHECNQGDLANNSPKDCRGRRDCLLAPSNEHHNGILLERGRESIRRPKTSRTCGY